MTTNYQHHLVDTCVFFSLSLRFQAASMEGATYNRIDFCVPFFALALVFSWGALTLALLYQMPANAYVQPLPETSTCPIKSKRLV